MKNNGIQKDDLYIIAICPDFEDFDERCILNTLFSLGKAIYRKSQTSNDLVGPFYEFRPNVKKHNGKNIDTNIFETKDFNRLNAIIYSKSRTIDIINNANIGSEFFISFNPNANFILDKNIFNFGYKIYKDENLVKISKQNKIILNS